MFTEIEFVEAETKLSALLQKTKHGQCYTITLRGEPIADLVPNGSVAYKNRRAAIEAMRRFQKVEGISSEQVATWIAEGRQ